LKGDDSTSQQHLTELQSRANTIPKRQERSMKNTMKNPIKISKWGGAIAAVLLFGSTSAWANFGGTVYCDANCSGVISAPIPGVTVNAYLCGTATIVGTTVTDANGVYAFEPSTAMPLGGSYFACAEIPPGYVPGPNNAGNPSLNTACAHGCYTFANPGDFTHNIGLCPTSGTCTAPPPPCPPCVDPELGLNAASDTTVLELGASQVSINGPAGGILGNIFIAPGGKANFSGGGEYLIGNVYLGAGATYQNSGLTVSGSVLFNQDLSAEIAAAYAAASSDASLGCSQTFATLDGKSVTTIVGGHGLNVICVTDINLSGSQIKITGPSDAKFIFNVKGKFVLTGGGAGPQIRVDTSAGLTPSDVLYNIIGTGPDVAFSGGGGGANCCAAIVDGTLLAPYRKIALSPGLVNGEVISGMDISIVSGSSVRCPVCH
jgi:choice-of-anchor A domain-containing protein